MAKEIKTIGILTSGGDAPGMNAAIRAVVRTAVSRGLSVKGIKRGYAGLLKEEIVDMDSNSVSDVINRGGTFYIQQDAMSLKPWRARKRELRSLRGMVLKDWW